MTLITSERTRAADVLTKAFLRAGEVLQLKGRELAQITGVSAASHSRLGKRRAIDPASKEGELAILFLRLFRALDGLVGGDDAAARAWIEAPHAGLGGRPMDLMQTAEGLVRVADYCEALHAQ